MNTAKNTSRATTSRTAGMAWLPSMRWLILMSCIVKTKLKTPQPMGRMAFSHTPRTMSYMVTVPALPSICVKSAERTPSVPMDASTCTWLSKIQLQTPRRVSHSQELMSSAMAANAGWGTRSAESRTAVAANASRKRRRCGLSRAMLAMGLVMVVSSF